MLKKNKIKVLMVAAEVAPMAKVGGLADVAGSIPPAILKLGVDVRLMVPLYGSINKKKYKLKKIYSDLEIPSGRLLIKTNIWETVLPNTKVKIYFIDAPDYFKYDEVYIKGDNSERFLFFSLASLYALPAIGFEPDIIHCHDSHTALIPDIIKTSNLEYIKNLKTLYTIHNFRYQGKTRTTVLSTANIHHESLKSLEIDASDGDINFMAQGVLNADLVNTVSPTYAKEITTDAFGAGLERIIRKRKKDLYGIVNGIDTKFFDPRKDKYIEHNFNANNLNGKTKNKLALQKELGLPVDASIPMAVIITRLVWQKGLELITEKFAKLNCQFVFLGTGQKEYEKQLTKLAEKYPNKISTNILFNLELAQKIYAASDIFLMPSRFEPCGLGQLIAMRYGSVPVVRETGGLADTVINLEYKKDKSNNYTFANTKKALGFNFKNVSSNEFYKSLQTALTVYYHYPDVWKKIMKNGMTADFSWDKSAKEYVKLYKKILKK